MVGTTGFTPEQLEELIKLSREKELGGLICSRTLALGAVLLMQFAAQAAKYFPNVEIIELHHDPERCSEWTVIATAYYQPARLQQQGAADEESIVGARGADFDGMRIHSPGLPGLVAHQEVILAARD